ncbi:MAG: transcriptional regulator [Planctomycetes bacterium]|nr:transcriptional regulator [Planctomycetota bacterium]
MFDSEQELLRRIQLGEDSALELKAVVLRGEKVVGPGRDELADELAAMANTADAALVLGVDDKSKDILGIPRSALDAVEEYVREVCNDSIRPPVMIRTYRMELPNATGEMRTVLKVEVPRSLFVHESPGGYFHRQGSSKRRMPPEYLARLFQQRSQARLIRFEEQAVPETGIQDLDEHLWRRFTAGSDESSEVVLLKRSLLTKDENGATRASVAGILMCSRSPERYLPGAYVEAVRYRGTVQDSNYQVDAQRIVGPLDRQIDVAMTFLRRNQLVSATKEPDRRERAQFSERAVFEAIVNAVAHRDYSIHGSKIRFFMFDDRLEVYSPGALPNTVTVETIALRQATRNELVTSLLADCPVPDGTGAIGRKHYMEKRGDGVPIIMRESIRLSSRSPVYRLIDDSELLLTIYAAPATTAPGKG